jgi:ketosteroid isomerase-like protein
METLVRLGQKVNQLYDAFNRRDINTILESLSPDCIWEIMGQPDIPYAGIFHGRDDVKEFFMKLDESIDMSDFTVEHILENGNYVMATGHLTAMARNTDKRFSSMWCMTFEFNDNEECVHFRDCFDTLATARAMMK